MMIEACIAICMLLNPQVRASEQTNTKKKSLNALESHAFFNLIHSGMLSPVNLRKLRVVNKEVQGIVRSRFNCFYRKANCRYNWDEASLLPFYDKKNPILTFSVMALDILNKNDKAMPRLEILFLQALDDLELNKPVEHKQNISKSSLALVETQLWECAIKQTRTQAIKTIKKNFEKQITSISEEKWNSLWSNTLEETKAKIWQQTNQQKHTYEEKTLEEAKNLTGKHLLSLPQQIKSMSKECADLILAKKSNNSKNNLKTTILPIIYTVSAINTLSYLIVKRSSPWKKTIKDLAKSLDEKIAAEN